MPGQIFLDRSAKRLISIDAIDSLRSIGSIELTDLIGLIDSAKLRIWVPRVCDAVPARETRLEQKAQSMPLLKLMQVEATSLAISFVQRPYVNC